DKVILPKLFTKFTTKSEAGVGLGLYNSKNIIKAHDSKIWAENNLDSKGATLRLHYQFHSNIFILILNTELVSYFWKSEIVIRLQY
ncbi:MAG: ATP-binding protein, partial [Nitrososphaeraceae archaeon]